jgi:lipopolysaccharide assembly outer membrane protein LptD (OstA)
LGALLACLSGQASAQGSRPAGGPFEIPAGCAIEFGSAAPEGEGKVRLSGYVDIECGGSRIQADSVLYDVKTRRGVAEGTVVLDWDGNRITGARLEFDLTAQTGTMESATGWIEPEALLKAESLEKLDEDHVLLLKGEFTTCTQPVPYWSFRIGRGLFHLDHYAHLRHVRLHVRGVPLLYIPYIVWPIKGDRATGLLFPQWGTSSRYGFYAGEAFFWAIAPNADVTVYGDYYADAGPGLGLETNWLPNERGRARLSGYSLWDRERDENRYHGRFQMLQRFGRGWRLGADLNEISDFLYYQDFDRDLAGAASGEVESVLNLVRTGETTSLNIRGIAREQFFTSGSGSSRILSQQLDQDTLPEVELRGRSRRLPGTPIHVAFESSADWFRSRSQSFYASGSTRTSEKTEWGRLDFEPRFMVPFSPAPWLSFEARGSLRQTYYTDRTIETFDRTFTTDPMSGDTVQEITTGEEEKGSIGRSFYKLEAEMIGPRLHKIFRSSSAYSPAYKHVIEPRLLYRYVPEIPEQPLVPVIDDRDTVSGDENLVVLSLRSRLLAKRPPRVTEPKPEPTDGSETGGALPWSSFPIPVEIPPTPAPVTIESKESESAEPAASAAAIPPVAASAGVGEGDPVEIASVEIGQAYSFDLPLTTVYGPSLACPSGGAPPCPAGEEAETVRTAQGNRHFGPLSLTLHFNPALAASVDLRADYDLANDTLVSSSLSGWYRWSTGYLGATYYRQEPAGSPDDRSSQLRLGSGAALFNRKLTLDGDLGYDLRGETALDRRARVGYYTQCCGFVVEFLRREFSGDDRKELRFVVDLKGIGKFLDVSGGGS